MGLSNSILSIKGGLKDLSHTNKACKMHPAPIIIPTRMHPFHLGTLLLIHHGPHLLLGLMRLSIIPNVLINHFSHMLLHILSGITHHKGGGINSTNLLLYCLHPNLNHNSLILLHLGNLIFMLNPI